MSKSRLELNREIQEGVNDYEYKKNLRKKNSLTKEEFQKNGVRLTDKQNDLYKGIRNNILTVVHGRQEQQKHLLPVIPRWLY